MQDWSNKGHGRVRVFEIGVELPIQEYHLQAIRTSRGVEYKYPEGGEIIRVEGRGSYKIQARTVKMDGTLNLYVKHESID